MPGRDRSYDPAEASHRALRGVRRELERHPIVAVAQGFPSGEHTRVDADLETTHAAVDAADATLTVAWFAGETPDARPEFSFHYSDETPGDFGWHHEPNPHVDGWGHFQTRPASTADYAYSPHEFSSTNPTRVVWEVASLLLDRLDS